MSARASRVSPLELQGRRIRLRTMSEDDYGQWIEVRARCRDWLIPWEPRPEGSPTTPEDRASFVARCAARERERQMGTGYGFGIFLEGRLVGEITLSSVSSAGPFENALRRLLDADPGAWPAGDWPPRPRWPCCASPSRT